MTPLEEQRRKLQATLFDMRYGQYGGTKRLLQFIEEGAYLHEMAEHFHLNTTSENSGISILSRTIKNLTGKTYRQNLKDKKVRRRRSSV